MLGCLLHRALDLASSPLECWQHSKQSSVNSGFTHSAKITLNPPFSLRLRLHGDECKKRPNKLSHLYDTVFIRGQKKRPHSAGDSVRPWFVARLRTE